jgi:DNA helicase-2/ATP-dependent DNA helicase PcrA
MQNQTTPEDISYILNDLNPAQHEAVSAAPGHRLVLAGAGSGKTRVLTHRIAWLIEVERVSPFGLLAVTFTNKAAAEMRSRIESLRGIPAGGMWVGTFHSIAHRLLRQHWQEAKLKQNFQIIDSNDQHRLVRRILKELGLDESKWPAKQTQWYINGKKDLGLRPQHVQTHDDVFECTMVKIYQAYEDACERAGLVDFAELLLRSHELWLNNPEILQHYQKRFKHILVDEFQDTNALQYAWLRVLAGKCAFLTLVGDDDQSIYGWRGAKIENILRFTEDYPTAETTRLEQNYRSTKNILSAANALIANNSGRLGKELWTDSKQGDPISVYAAFNEIDEARFIVGRIQDWFNQGNKYSESAIVYRSNAQSRVLEEALLQCKIPYRVYGGQRFFDRVEIKDALAYLRLISNRSDDAAFERVVNTPTRGIGDRTIELIRGCARSNNTTMWQAAFELTNNAGLAARASNAVKNFLQLIDNMAEHTAKVELHEQAEHAIHTSGLNEHFKKEKGEKAQMRLENLAELVTATRQFSADEIEGTEDLTPLQAFLSHAALEAGESQAGPAQDCVQMMTLHSAKGLEFPLVFIAGTEEGLFPHERSIEDPDRLEEERRLCYVGVTRAMQKLYLTYAETRRLYGREVYHKISRFITEIPDEHLEEVRMNAHVSRPVYSRPQYAAKPASRYADDKQPYKLGSSVHHVKFGTGVVLNYEGAGGHSRIQINFPEAGIKWLMLSHAKLTVI